MRHAKNSPVSTGISPGFARSPASRGPDTTAEVLFIGTDEALAAACRTVAAAAGVGLDVREAAPADDGLWSVAPLVLVSAGCPVEAPRRPGVVVVARAPVGDSVWQDAVDLGAEHVAVLPDAEGWLAQRMVEAVETRRAQGRVVGVVAGCGGAGASVLACGLARCSARAGVECVLVDADPLGGGIDLALGAEELAGMRWDDLSSVRGRLQPGMLAGLLPQVDGVRVLSFARHADQATDVPPDAMRAVLTSARAQAEVVIVDLPRQFGPQDGDAAAVARGVCDVVFLVVPAHVRAAAAGVAVLARLNASVGDVRLVVRRIRGGLDPRAVADALAAPLAAVLPSDAAVAAALDRGEPADLNSRGPLSRTCSALLDDLQLPGARPARGTGRRGRRSA